MSRRPHIIVAIAATTAALLGFLTWSTRRVHAPHVPSAVETAAAAPVLAGAPVVTPPARRAAWARYRLSSSQHGGLNGKEASVVTEGTWTTVERAGGRVEVQFAASRIEVIGDEAPSAADVADPFELVIQEGVLHGIAFSERTSRRARALLTGLATTFQTSSGSGASWTVEEEDLQGRYVAEYQRSGDHVARTRPRYTALRHATGLTAAGAEQLETGEQSELRFDDRGLVSATVRVEHRASFGRGRIGLSMSLSATLVREASEERSLVAGVGGDAAPISNHIDHAGRAKARARSLVAGKKAPELLAEAVKAAHIARSVADAPQQRGAAIRRLAALTELDPAAAGAIAGEIRRDPSDRAAVDLLIGALSTSVEPSATNQLASLLKSDDLPAGVRSQVIAQLGLARTPTSESATALIDALPGSSGDEAALALGTEARGLTDPSAQPSFNAAGEDAIDQLLARYAAATTYTEKRLALLALANTGSDRVLDVLVSNIQGSDFDLARVATVGLRLIQDPEVDDLLNTLLQGGSTLVLSAIQAISYRDSTVWRPRLLAAQEMYASQKQVSEAIQKVLSRWTLATN